MTQMLNTTLCFLGAAFVFVYFRRIVYAFPITIESVWQIGLAEVNHRRSKRRVEFLEAGVDAEWGNLGKRSPTRCIGSVVGYREDSDLFRKCLESYRHCAGLEIMLVGIDGNEAPDMEMANIARSVCVPAAAPKHRADSGRCTPTTLRSSRFRNRWQPLRYALLETSLWKS
jgi:hyaluronan synthase